jgi:hypothetical protein
MSKQKLYGLSGDYSPGKAARRQKFQMRLKHMRKDKAQRFSDVS